MNQKRAFTLIELMVVVAIIAVLAVLAVANFSSAIKRTRNAARQSDIQAVAKAMETCYDVLAGKYSGLNGLTSGTVSNSGTSNGPFSVALNSCLNDNIGPQMASYPYYYDVSSGSPQAFYICAKLEPVGNWESVGNSSTVPSASTTTLTDCGTATTGTASCYYCVRNQQ